MINCIYLAWQDQKTKRWHVIGRLSRIPEGYEFRYTKGVKKIPSFSPMPNMTNYEETYKSSELFSLFKNRLMPKSRPEYRDYMTWLGFEENNVVLDNLEVLAISGGERETDFFRIIPVPEKNHKGDYSIKFFVHGLSHMSDVAKQVMKNLNEGDSLYLAHDFQNKVDSLALILRTEDPPFIVGYMPSYFTKIIHKLGNGNNNLLSSIKVNVLRVNKTAPEKMQLLCQLSGPFLDKSWEEYEEEFCVIST
jgi:hypothetical protein